MTIKTINDIKNAFYINLEERTDRKEHVEKQLENIGISANRFNAIKMENGAIGCSMSHLKLLQMAFDQKMDHILIVEDDILFLNPELFITQFNKFMDLHSDSWDVVLFAGNNMPPYENIDDTCVRVTRCQTTTGYLVNGHYIKALLTNVKMGLTQLLKNPTEKNTFAIDKFWFVLQKTCKWFLIIPPSVIQKEGYSNIEQKHTSYEILMLDLDKKELFDSIRKTREKQGLFKKSLDLPKKSTNFGLQFN